jgi:hypothetical protein
MAEKKAQAFKKYDMQAKGRKNIHAKQGIGDER